MNFKIIDTKEFDNYILEKYGIYNSEISFRQETKTILNNMQKREFMTLLTLAKLTFKLKLISTAAIMKKYFYLTEMEWEFTFNPRDTTVVDGSFDVGCVPMGH